MIKDGLYFLNHFSYIYEQDMGEPKGWRGLASLLLEAACNNGAGGDESVEIDDLCTKMRSGKLKGF
jgi:hypothetical protein